MPYLLLDKYSTYTPAVRFANIHMSISYLAKKKNNINKPKQNNNKISEHKLLTVAAAAAGKR